jgi:hypothetical protein
MRPVITLLATQPLVIAMIQMLDGTEIVSDVSALRTFTGMALTARPAIQAARVAVETMPPVLRLAHAHVWTETPGGISRRAADVCSISTGMDLAACNALQMPRMERETSSLTHHLHATAMM